MAVIFKRTALSLINSYPVPELTVEKKNTYVDNFTSDTERQ